MPTDDLGGQLAQEGKNQLRPHPTLSGYYDSDAERSVYIRKLFDASARHYDRISGVMSFGTDKRYRRKVLLKWGLAQGMTMLDVACGTGLVSENASEIVGPEGCVVGLDPSQGMLGEAVGQGRVTWAVRGLGEQLPLADDSFDFLSMGFALRHVSDLRAAFAEYRRVLKPGGRVLILDFTTPSSQLSYGLFKFYMKDLLPKITRLSTFNREAQSLMQYFWETVDQCVPPETILEAMEQVGFERIETHVQARIFIEYAALKP